MGHRTCFRCFGAVTALATALTIALSSPAEAQGTGEVPVFARMSGQWTGEGTIRTSNGGSERIRCRATYTVHGGGNSLKQEMLCASDSYKFQLSSDLVLGAATISGQWVETTRNLSGVVIGEVNGNLIQARVQGVAFAARFAVSTLGNRQAITIAPQGTDVTEVAITMSRRAP